MAGFFLGCWETQRPLHTLANQSSRKQASEKQGELLLQQARRHRRNRGSDPQEHMGKKDHRRSLIQPPSCNRTAANKRSGQPGLVWVMLETSTDGDASPPAFFFPNVQAKLPMFPYYVTCRGCQKESDRIIFLTALHIAVPVIRYAPSRLFTTPSCPSSPLSSQALCPQP